MGTELCSVERWRRRALGLAFALVASAGVPGCAMLATTWHYQPAHASVRGAKVELGGRPVWSWPQAFEPWGLGLGISGTPRVLTLSEQDVAIEVSSREIDWRVHSLGPVLPVIPNFIGGGMEREPTLALHLHVAECAAPVKVLLGRTRVTTAGGDLHEIHACLTGDDAWGYESPARAAPLAEDPLLKRGGGLWIAFDVQHAELDAFELELALESEGAAPIEATLAFERSNATYYVLAWWAPDVDE